MFQSKILIPIMKNIFNIKINVSILKIIVVIIFLIIKLKNIESEN